VAYLENEEHEALSLKIVQKKSGAYELQGFSIKKLKALEEWHSKRHLPRKWSVSKDGSHLVLM